MRMTRCNNVARRWSNDCNTKQHPRLQHETTPQTTTKMLHDVARKFDENQTLSNFMQHRATGWSNGCNMLRATMLHEILHPFDRGFRLSQSHRHPSKVRIV